MPSVRSKPADSGWGTQPLGPARTATGSDDDPERDPSPMADRLVLWGCVLMVCTVFGMTQHRHSARRRSAEKLAGKNVVIAPPGTADAQDLSSSDSSAFAKVRVQNPPGAITFVLELKKTFEEY
jgi:hypothetical protein